MLLLLLLRRYVLFALALIGVIPPESAGEVLFGLKIGLVDLLVHTLLNMPYSRLMEKEADLIGLDNMVRRSHQPRPRQTEGSA